MIRLAHLADVHLGAALRDLDPYPGAPAIDPVGAAWEASRRLVESVVEAAPDAVLIAGDLFDRDVDPELAVPVAQTALDTFHAAGIRTAIIAGNHDAETGSLDALRLPSSAALLGLVGAEALRWDELGLAIVGRSICRADEPEDLAAGYPTSAALHAQGLRVVGMLHTSLAGASSRRVCAPTSTRMLDRVGYDYWALGHVHIPHAVGAATPAWFAGGGHARRAEETGPRGWLEVRLLGKEADDRVEVELHQSAPVRYEAIGDAGLDDLATTVADARDGDAIVWVLPARRRELLQEARRVAGADPAAMVVVGR